MKKDLYPCTGCGRLIFEFSDQICQDCIELAKECSIGLDLEELEDEYE